MINFEEFPDRYEFIYKVNDGYVAAYLLKKYPETDRMKYLTNWFNAILRLKDET
jgi:hypothetical protein